MRSRCLRGTGGVGVIVGALLTLAPAFGVCRADVVFYTDIVAFGGVSQTTLVEDFESVLPRSTPLTSFVSQGNTFIGLAGIDLQSQPFPNVYLAPPGSTSFMIGTPTTSTVLTANGDEDIRVELGTPVTAVGFDTYNAISSATIQVFGAGGLLESFVFDAVPNEVGFLGFVSSEPITAFRWTTVLGAIVDTGFDNVRLGSAVPEPSSVIMLGIGALGVLVHGRRLRATGS